MQELSEAQVWDSPTAGLQGHRYFLFMFTVHVQSCSPRLWDSTNGHPMCNMKTSVSSSRVSHSDSPLPPSSLCLTQSQCNLPEIEFRQAPGKSEGSTQLKLQLKIFLLDLSTLKLGARVPWSWRQKAAPSPTAHSSSGLFQNCN